MIGAAKGATLFGCAVIISSCAPLVTDSPKVPSSPSALRPPVIELTERVASTQIFSDSVKYTTVDGRSVSISMADRRLITGSWDAQLVILGHDELGGFIATYQIQQGLPSDCFVDGSEGIDRGDYVELHGVLWKKTYRFKSSSDTHVDHSYPLGTRFCYDARGFISGIVTP
jgi:hypothetical protein